ncbi:hypothetical protein BD310DRAFT_939364 [Dichomitus squalens]|uniref:Transmembrane protein n=1 Tax=Dichomitus squalens TaxID=114155 RepID=A0A4V6MWM3_9APHY|nr:hypothetical protein BD310DRAFT_939364 [Dichomitus squalens]
MTRQAMSPSDLSSYEDIALPKSPELPNSVQLTPYHNSRVRRISWISFAPVPTFAMAYVVHRYYRYCRPLRFDPG